MCLNLVALRRAEMNGKGRVYGFAKDAAAAVRRDCISSLGFGWGGSTAPFPPGPAPTLACTCLQLIEQGVAGRFTKYGRVAARRAAVSQATDGLPLLYKMIAIKTPRQRGDSNPIVELAVRLRGMISNENGQVFVGNGV
jgi:hypothetical protein